MTAPAEPTLVAAPKGMPLVTAIVALLVLGAAWGVSVPLTKVATSSGHGIFGLIFWQLVVVAVALVCVQVIQRKPIRVRSHHLVLLLAIALLGTLIPNSFTYLAISRIPAGVHAIMMSLVPMFAFVIAMAMRNEAFVPLRLCGVLLGLLGVLLIIGPEASLPEKGMWLFVLIGALGTVCYGIEGNYVARFGLGGLNPVEVLLYSSILGAVLVLPLTLGTGQFIDLSQAWAAPEYALVGLSLLHAVAYVGYIWLVGQAGPIFAAQVSYPVTLFGVLASIVILGESYSGWVWWALVIMLVGLFLVQPRKATT
ncbi:MAG: DMT family transporter [Pseudomonadota bacterium]